jgi:hypothetical protein
MEANNERFKVLRGTVVSWNDAHQDKKEVNNEE